jgi:hypothetical protein
MRHLAHSAALLPVAGAALLLGAAPSSASAQGADSLYPLRALDRPATLPRGAARLDLSLSASRRPGVPAAWLVILGGGVGVRNDVEIGGQLLPLSLAPGRASVGDPSVYGSYTFDAFGLTFVPTLQVVYPLTDADPFLVDIGIPVDRNIGRLGSVQLSPTLSIDTRADGAGASVAIPVLFLRQESATLTWQLSSGVGLSRFDPGSGLGRRRAPDDLDDVTIPLVVEATYSVPRPGRRRPWADLTLQLAWPRLYARAPAQRGSHADDWMLQLQSSWYAIP